MLSHFRRNVHPYGHHSQSSAHQRYSPYQQSQKASYYGARQGGGGGMGGQASGGGQGGGQSSVGPDFQLFELVQREEMYMPSLGQAALRQTHVEFLSLIRLTDYRKQYDTLTVSP